MMSSVDAQTLLYIALGASALAVVSAAVLWWQTVLMRKRLEALLRGAKGQDLEDILAEQGKRLRELGEELKRVRNDVARLDVMASASIQKVGLVRFNPFNDTGGDQSFALALLDSDDNGIVVSSLHSREGTRMYAKSVVKRESRHHLSDEEREAIRRALVGE